jgi:hypothetical protein
VHKNPVSRKYLPEGKSCIDLFLADGEVIPRMPIRSDNSMTFIEGEQASPGLIIGRGYRNDPVLPESVSEKPLLNGKGGFDHESKYQCVRVRRPTAIARHHCEHRRYFTVMIKNRRTAADRCAKCSSRHR